MAHLGDGELSERGRVIFLAVITSGAIVLTTAAFALADEWRLFEWFDRQWWPVTLAFHVAVWGAVMFAFSRVREALRLATSLSVQAGDLLLWLASVLSYQAARFVLSVVRVCGRLPGDVLRFLFGTRYDALLTAVRLVTDPWMSPVARFYDGWILPLPTRFTGVPAGWRVERKLRRAYRKEFREHYASYRAFRAAFLQEQAGEQSGAASAPPPDLFAGACAALGLAPDGSFTSEAFKAQYRARMKVSHPDVAGNHNQAAALNAAADVIKTRKGWQ